MDRIEIPLHGNKFQSNPVCISKTLYPRATQVKVKRQPWFSFTSFTIKRECIQIQGILKKTLPFQYVILSAAYNIIMRTNRKIKNEDMLSVLESNTQNFVSKQIVI